MSDYFIDKQGNKRYATGNSLGKHPGSLSPGNSHAINKDNAQAMQERRAEKRRDAIRDALMAHPDASTDSDGLRMIAEAQVTLASDPDAGHASTGAAKFIYNAGDYWKDDRGKIPQMAIQVNIGQSVIDQALTLSENIVMLDETENE